MPISNGIVFASCKNEREPRSEPSAFIVCSELLGCVLALQGSLNVFGTVATVL